MTEFHFLRPYWLLALIPLAALYWALKRSRQAEGDWRAVCDAELLPHLLIDMPGRARGWQFRSAWLYAAAVLAILALAGPAWERLPVPAFRNDQALVLVLDLSPAMDATDISPSRLDRARYKVEDILRGRKDGQNALVVYADDAFTVTPLTDDSETIISQLSALSTALMPGQAEAHPETGLARAKSLLQQAGLIHGDILLISSGAGAAQAEDAASEARAAGMRVSVLAVGTETGGPVPLPNGGFRRSDTGSIWVAQLDAKDLQRLTTVGGGEYRLLTNNDADLRALLPFFDTRDPTAQRPGESSMLLEQWQERGPWLLIPVIPLAALAFRRGFIAMWLLVALLPLPEPAAAFEWQDWFLTREQQAQRAYDRGDFEDAAKLFEDPAWKAAAQYKAGKTQEAAKTLKGAESADGLYNKGNALAKAGQYQEAIHSYDQALQRRPNDEDAEYNKNLVEEALKQQKQQQKQQGSGDDKDQDHKDQEKSEQNQQQESKAEQGEKDAPEKQQQQSSDQNQQGKQGDGERQEDAAEQPSEGGRQAPSEKTGEEGQKQSESGKPEGQKSAEEQQAEERQGKQSNEADKSDSSPPSKGKANATEHRESEDQQASEQWLRRIPDDPGGLLKRKFYYQYQQRQRRGP